MILFRLLWFLWHYFLALKCQNMVLESGSNQLPQCREVIQLVGSVATIQRSALSPLLPKIMSFLCKRIREARSAHVREACVETAALVAHHIPPPLRTKTGDEPDGTFVFMLKPLLALVRDQVLKPRILLCNVSSG